ncbi:retron St85 family RNA-directed DNA polymerase [Vibrio cholerae]|uniref:retron St85 family RNA-directed DNA polymerase n=1 Tax=Vibrio cholerae TaxID=666 RepID=UPI003080B793
MTYISNKQKTNNSGLYTQRMLALPELQSLNDFAAKIRVTPELLTKYTGNNKHHYAVHQEEKKTPGQYREISSPTSELKALQRWILRNILDKLSPSPYAKGFIKKKCLFDNAKPHEGKQYVLNLDLKDFFSSVSSKNVCTLFKSLGYPPLLSYQMTNICTLNGCLPQGAPTSPALSNLVTIRMDYRIGKYCEKYALTYTRYADDMTISGNKLSIVKKARIMINKIIREESFYIHPKKNKLSGPSVRREVTGLVVNESLGIGREKYNFYRTKMFKLHKEQHPNFESVSSGIIAFVRSVDIVRAQKLHAYFEKLRIKN